MTRVRFAPSPTGFLHIGSARTALFNWMYARSTGGAFILRIEDTDLARSKKEFEEEILSSMSWLGLNWDELYYQSKRFDLYREHAQRLVKEGKAYRDNGAVILKTPKKEIKLYDLIRGEIVFDTSHFLDRNEDNTPVLDKDGNPKLKDEILLKSDGSPAFSFCNVIDDALMEISCVIRGEDHISNTPKQILMYEALGFKPPKYAHLPLIMGEEGGRLSKRFGAVAVSEYKEMGFLPQAMLNYLARLGWSHGDQEIFTKNELIEYFDLKVIGKSPSVFDIEKCTWVNSQHLAKLSDKELLEWTKPYLETLGIKVTDDGYAAKALHSERERGKTLKALAEIAAFYLRDEVVRDENAAQKWLTDDGK